MRRFGSDDSWDKLLEVGVCLLQFTLFRGGSSIFSSRLRGLVFLDLSRTEMKGPPSCR